MQSAFTIKRVEGYPFRSSNARVFRKAYSHPNIFKGLVIYSARLPSILADHEQPPPTNIREISQSQNFLNLVLKR